MQRSRVILLILTAATAGLVLGVYLGFAYFGRPSRSWAALAAVAWSGESAWHHYQNADDSDARAALEGHLRVLQTFAAHPEYDLGTSVHTDIALTYTRLALLAERRGTSTEAAALLQRAVAEAHLGHWKQPTAEALRSFVQRVDRPRPLPAPTPQQTPSGA